MKLVAWSVSRKEVWAQGPLGWSRLCPEPPSQLCHLLPTLASLALANLFPLQRVSRGCRLRRLRGAGAVFISLTRRWAVGWEGQGDVGDAVGKSGGEALERQLVAAAGVGSMQVGTDPAMLVGR